MSHNDSEGCVVCSKRRGRLRIVRKGYQSFSMATFVAAVGAMGVAFLLLVGAGINGMALAAADTPGHGGWGWAYGWSIVFVVGTIFLVISILRGWYAFMMQETSFEWQE